MGRSIAENKYRKDVPVWRYVKMIGKMREQLDDGRGKEEIFDKCGTSFRVTSMTGERRIGLVASTLALQNWINNHPRKNNPEAYLWCETRLINNPKRKNNHLSYGFIYRLLNELAVKAKVKKAVNPHDFRHARATFLAKHLKEPEMREFFGWNK